MVLVTSHGFQRRLSRLAPLDVDGGDRRRRHRHGARLRLLLRAARRRSRGAGEDRHASPASARSSGSIRARSRRAACRWCSTRASPARWSGHLASAINGASIARKTSFLKDRMGEKLFRSGIRIVDDPLRKRGLRSHPFDGEGVAGKRLALIEDGVLKSWFLDSRDRARARARHHRPCVARRVVVALARRRPICISKPGTHDAAAADRRHRGRLLRHRPDRHGRQSRHRRLQPRRVRASGSRTANSPIR